ncbi:MAG: hypothetical protein A3J09_00805 [Candidatus Zambryskibacteria bacterium RIFCSPLOWO2_02_FULL_51_21]|uniref:SGNH hydrolase-type esterase domain-containing protein n=1 Tax=Candidatus Zambryskibacteria bacterium RIFCSPHIGHO2_02_FULL_43_37 TaxID=1802749 RepID=A0A1G2TJ94_9BACT|nr:MAG: hypothetical protein A2723_00805 [Candidatus Zambryskibacteria bacterium RIFCSPHIGHO2_01_FULL_52_18]OHA96739.1 MAG: hypothetical protein A3D49_02765 [Candidatus Zambryskibacteria bacterium RIFCSPHIGHO2_02_FULL_43_37]OHB07432.1 MAG: hypothetical protein A2944_01835 [Candidatus Zambryskibacteria bacterium RIFCSPLOWO2_01_FULL_52_12]OHB11095.1 MAG: hypothetical protein A3J09_00805 [Candidatus Zambryskibacteria bacterium RIFCSPLOWO2_02_FULL_51_21]
MKIFILAIALLAVAILGVFFARGRAIINYPSSGTDIVAFGDSLVEGVGSAQAGGFVRMLSEDLNIPIINLGVSGNTTADALKRIKELDRYKPKVVMILLGGNDYLQKVPKEETLANMNKIIDEAQKRGAVVLFLGLDKSYGSLAKETGAAYIPDILGGILGNKNLMSDSLHPNDLGYRLMADRVKPVLKELID